MSENASPRVAIAGIEGALGSLLRDVLADLNAELVALGQSHADLVFVEFARAPALEERVATAKAIAPEAEVVVLLPFGDEQHALEALLAGADATFALGSPLRAFRDMLTALLRKPKRAGAVGRA
ncbi:MAG: DNA-binding response regulator [Deltaproteobacteria bacterium]|nr:DNA-binding response regulator [Deltaproteobacteria bacterium]